MVSATSTLNNQQQPSWSQALEQPASEFELTPLSPLSGAIPEGLRGSLYRNGPARLERGGRRVGHWFDGDGAILGIHFTDAGTTGVYRYVQTAGYRAEAEAGQLLYGNYGMVPPGAFWNRLRYGVKNVANTSVLALPDRVLALWEGGHPHALSLETLETLELDNLSSLPPGQPFSAHPKRDAQSGEIYNFGVSYGKQGKLHLYRSDRTGRIVQQNSVPLDRLPMIHDFVLAGAYLVFFISPLNMALLPLLTRQKSYSDCLRWQPELGTQILVIDRDTLELVSQAEAEPWYQWHFGNGHINDQGQIVVDVTRYSDFRTNQFLKEVATGQTFTEAPSALWRLFVNPETAQLEEQYEVLGRDNEFPSVNPQEVSQASRYTYLSLRSEGRSATDLFNTIGRVDHRTGELIEAELGTHRYASEPLYAPDRFQADRGWVLVTVFDSDRHQSEVWVFDSAHLNRDPVCRLSLPSVVPMGFHGTWHSA